MKKNVAEYMTYCVNNHKVCTFKFLLKSIAIERKLPLMQSLEVVLVTLENRPLEMYDLYVMYRGNFF